MALSIVIPAYNESQRLPVTLDSLLQETTIPFNEVIVVNDGSHDDTLEVAKSFEKRFSGRIKVVDSQPNRGKGFAVRRGIEEASQEWVLVADADRSTPWREYFKLLSAQERSASMGAIGSRDVDGSVLMAQQPFYREWLGKLFNFFLRSLTGLKFKDTQCGFKLFHRESFLKFFPELREDRFAWDVEFLMFAKKYKLPVVEVPVEWAHVKGGTVHPIRDGLKMVWAVLQMRARVGR